MSNIVNVDQIRQFSPCKDVNFLMMSDGNEDWENNIKNRQLTSTLARQNGHPTFQPIPCLFNIPSKQDLQKEWRQGRTLGSLNCCEQTPHCSSFAKVSAKVSAKVEAFAIRSMEWISSRHAERERERREIVLRKKSSCFFQPVTMHSSSVQQVLLKQLSITVRRVSLPDHVIDSIFPRKFFLCINLANQIYCHGHLLAWYQKLTNVLHHTQIDSDTETWFAME